MHGGGKNARFMASKRVLPGLIPQFLGLCVITMRKLRLFYVPDYASRFLKGEGKWGGWQECIYSLSLSCFWLILHNDGLIFDLQETDSPGMVLIKPTCWSKRAPLCGCRTGFHFWAISMMAGRPALSPEIAFLLFWRAWPDLCKVGLMCVGTLDGWIPPFAEIPGLATDCCGFLPWPLHMQFDLLEMPSQTATRSTSMEGTDPSWERGEACVF